MWTTLAGLASDAGWDCVTIDQFERARSSYGSAYLVAQVYRLSATSRRLIDSGSVVPAVAVSLESPLTSPEFYFARGALCAAFSHVFAFPGAFRGGFAGRGTLHSMTWPYERPRARTEAAETARDRLVLVNSNRRSDLAVIPGFEPSRPIVSARRLLRYAARVSRTRRELGFMPELYRVRLDAIEYFARSGGFDLFGLDWDKPIAGAETRFRSAVDACYRGTIPPGEKLEVLSRYRFALCFENTCFPGYVTEKIFDCMAAGCVPVYLGAPDIASYVPEATFIDMRRFSGFAELAAHLDSLDDEALGEYRQAADEFFRSSLFDTFDQAKIAADIMKCLRDDAGGER